MTEFEKLQKKRRAIAAKLTNPKAVELPSGAFRCQKMVNGERISVVDEDPEVAHAKVNAMAAGVLAKEKPVANLTVGEAIDRYIESKDSVLSPSTVAGYKRTRKNDLQELMGIGLRDITQEQVQRAINKMAKAKSPKTIRNAHGLLSAALALYRPDFVLRTTLPQKQRYDAAIPSYEDISAIVSTAEGSESELPILLALWLGLRMSEILGLTWSSVGSGYLHIKEALVDEGVKGTKTYSSNRKLRIPPYIQTLLDNQPGNHAPDERIVNATRRTLYCRFQSVCKKAGIEQHYRFHDLRHANASVMLALNVPDKYAMERTGHSSNNMLKTVYQHTMRSKHEEVADQVDGYFAEILHTKLHTE